MKTSLAITGVGMLTSAGLNANVCFHSIRSSITRLTLQPYSDRIRNWVVGGAVLTWTPGLRERRLQGLAEKAFQEAWKQATGSSDPGLLGPVALIVGEPEAIRPGYRFPPSRLRLSSWLAEMGVRKIGTREILQAGHCNGLLALQRAAQILNSGEARVCAIGVADTQLQIRVIRWHEDHYRLKCGYLTDGLMPAEASGFLVVELEQSALARGADVLARIPALAVEREKATILADQPNTAAGLTTAVRTALKDAEIGPTDIEAVWCDLNGESYRAREWAFTEIRNGIQDRTELIHPADCYGDLGAASDTILLGLAAEAQATGWAKGRPLLVFGGSEDGVRAAAVVAPMPESSRGPPLIQVTVDVPRTLPINHEVSELGPDEIVYLQTEDPPRSYFEWELRHEHLDELISLYYQRKTLWTDAEVEWRRVREPEQRILNHLDAAVAGGPLSIWTVASGLQSDDEGSCFAGSLMLAVLANPTNLDRIDDVLQDPTSSNLTGIQAGLKHIRHPALEQKIKAWLNHDFMEVQAMAASLSGYLALGDPSHLLPALDSDDLELVRAATGAIRRFRYTRATRALQRLIDHEDPFVQHDALLALLCFQSDTAQEHCRRICQHGWKPGVRAPLLLAMCGNLSDLSVLWAQEHEPSRLPEVIEATGILGNVAAIPFLIDVLQSNDESAKLASAEALELMTAAGLRETAVVVTIEEEFEGEFEEEESEVERKSTSWEDWYEWWRRHESRFKHHLRWRRGEPFDLGICVDELSVGTTPLHQRQRAYWELVLLSSHDIPFETDWFVTHQTESISRWQDWLQLNNRN